MHETERTQAMAAGGGGGAVELPRAIRDYPYYDWFHLRLQDPEPLRRRFLSRVARLLSEPTTTLRGEAEGGESAWFLAALQRFDSDVFGCPTYRVVAAGTGPPRSELTRLLSEWLGELGPGPFHVHARVPLSDPRAIHEIENAGFRVADVNLVYRLDCRRVQVPPLEYRCEIRERRPEDDDALLRVAFESYSRGRFFADPNIPRPLAQEYYRRWLENSLRGQMATGVIVAAVEGHAVGYVTYVDHALESPPIPLGRMVLAAVDSKARGAGAYTAMIHRGLTLLSAGAEVVSLGTQADNLFVQRAWQRLGCRLSYAGLDLHCSRIPQ